MTEIELHKEALEKFRLLAGDVVQPTHHDLYLLQWLKARDYDPKKAAKMYRDSMAWRKSQECDTLLDKWERPEVFKKYYPAGLVSYDKEGSPVWIFNIAKLDIPGMHRSATREELIKNCAHILESSLRDMAKQSDKLGRYIHNHIVICDAEDWSWKHALSRDAQSIFRAYVAVHENNYPETLKKGFVVNASWVFTTIYNLLKPLMSEATKSKIVVYGTDKSKWVPAILELIDADQVPKHWGGTMVDSDGDPMCPSKCPKGGKVPKKYYLKNKSTLSQGEYERSVTVEKGGSLQVEYHIKEVCSQLSWAFETDDYDIGFAVYRSEGGRLVEVVPYSRVESHISSIESQTGPLQVGKYAVVFDNSYSLLTAKSLSYSVFVIPPQERAKN